MSWVKRNRKQNNYNNDDIRCGALSQLDINVKVNVNYVLSAMKENNYYAKEKDCGDEVLAWSKTNLALLHHFVVRLSAAVRHISSNELPKTPIRTVASTHTRMEVRTCHPFGSGPSRPSSGSSKNITTATRR